MWRLHAQEERVSGEVLRAVGHEEEGRGVGHGEAEHAQHLGDTRGIHGRHMGDIWERPSTRSTWRAARRGVWGAGCGVRGEG